MPIKEFECEACHHKFEDILALSEPNPTVCPKCGKGPLKSLLGSFKIAGIHKKSAPSDEFGAEGGGGGDPMGGDLGGMGGGDFGGDMGGGDMGLGDSDDAGGGGDDSFGAGGVDE
jgi:putative FmdB family regulatory protein